MLFPLYHSSLLDHSLFRNNDTWTKTVSPLALLFKFKDGQNHRQKLGRAGKINRRCLSWSRPLQGQLEEWAAGF